MQFVSLFAHDNGMIPNTFLPFEFGNVKLQIPNDYLAIHTSSHNSIGVQWVPFKTIDVVGTSQKNLMEKNRENEAKYHFFVKWKIRTCGNKGCAIDQIINIVGITILFVKLLKYSS